MFDVVTRFVPKPKRLQRAIAKANFRNINHAAATIRKDAVSTVIQAPQGIASRPGSPPFTHRRGFYRRAIRFEVNRQKNHALIGPRYSVVGDVGQAHEFGRPRGNQTYPKRPTMRPALERKAPRLGEIWEGTIGV